MYDETTQHSNNKLSTRHFNNRDGEYKDVYTTPLESPCINDITEKLIRYTDDCNTDDCNTDDCNTESD
jgi:hypothetical protein